MSKATLKRQQFSMDFKLQLLKEYYESGSSMYGISKKYGVDDATFIRWVKLYESKSLSLPQELIELYCCPLKLRTSRTLTRIRIQALKNKNLG